MPLHINLLHEEQSKVTERKRDPLKLGILAMLLVGMSFYGFYLLKSIGAGKIAAEKADLDRQFATIAPKSTQAQLDQSNSTLAINATKAVEGLINGRFYWGPLFTEIVAGTGPEIQLTSLDGTSNTTESVTLNVLGVSAGREPRAVAESFRQSMEKRLAAKYGTVTSAFVSLENSDTPLVIAERSYATANFSIGFQITLKSK